MKRILISLLLLSTTYLFAQEKKENEWVFDRLNYYFENDKLFGTDDDYTAGSQWTSLFFISKQNYPIFDLLGYDDEKTYSYATFSIANQMFTPEDFNTTTLIPDDRPYAGWSYIESSIHKTTKSELRSLSLQIGVVGPGSGSKQIQSEFHRIIDSEISRGWHNQLKNELGINLKYTQKWRFYSNISNDFESSIVPFVSAEFGNIAINATTGLKARIGWNIPKDYSITSIDLGADPGIPVYGEYSKMKLKPWSLSFNFTVAASGVARDIFLDGNTFEDSHSVAKEHFIAQYGVGATLRYKSFVIDISEIETTKQFKLQKKTHGMVNLIFSWLF